MKLGVVVVSTREERVGKIVSDWFADFAKEQSDYDVETLDLKEINLPLLDEPKHPVMKDYQFEHTKNWSALVEPCDAFVFVTPEYDYAAPASLVNAVSYLAQEWNYKPVGFVSYGGISGGLRSVQSAKPMLTTLKMMPIPEGVSFHFVQNNIADDKLTPERKHEDMARMMLNELAKWSEVLAGLRNSAS